MALFPWGSILKGPHDWGASLGVMEEKAAPSEGACEGIACGVPRDGPLRGRITLDCECLISAFPILLVIQNVAKRSEESELVSLCKRI
jgi:hypothetical protein